MSKRSSKVINLRHSASNATKFNAERAKRAPRLSNFLIKQWKKFQIDQY